MSKIDNWSDYLGGMDKQFIYPFPSNDPPPEGARLPRDARGFDELAAAATVYPFCLPCAPEDIHVLCTRLEKAFVRKAAVYLAGGWCEPTLPGRLDTCVWFMEDLVSIANGYGLKDGDVYDAAERALPPWSHFLLSTAITRWHERPLYKPNDASNQVAAERIENEERKAREREEKALKREIEARKVTDQTSAKLGAIVIEWAAAGDRTETQLVGPNVLDAKTPHMLKGGLNASDGRTFFVCHPGQAAGIPVPSVSGRDWRLVPANEVLPGEWTLSQWQTAQNANKSLPASLWTAITQARKAAGVELGPMDEAGGLTGDTLRGRAAIARGRERAREFAHAFDNHDSAAIYVLAEFLTRGLDVRMLEASDILLEVQNERLARHFSPFAQAEDTRLQWLRRVCMGVRAAGVYLSPGELLPAAEQASEASSGDPWQDVLAPLVQGRDEVLRDELVLSLRSAGLATVLTNLASGRLTQVMKRLGFSKKAAIRDGQAQRAYGRAQS